MKKNIGKSAIKKKVVLSVLLSFFAIIIVGILIPLDNVNTIDNNVNPSDFSLLGIDNSLNYTTVKMNDILDGSLLDTVDGYSDLVYKFDNDDLTIKFDTLVQGDYYIALDYLSYEQTVNPININIAINGEQTTEQKNITLQTYWTNNTTEELTFDIYRNEVVPIQSAYYIWKTSYLYDQTFLDPTPVLYSFDDVNNEISISKIGGDFYLGNIYLVEKEDYRTYESYKAGFTSNNASDQLITLEAENPLFKSSSEVRATSYSEPHMTPFSTKYNYLNAIPGSSFNKSGQALTYAFNVEQDGYYNISMKYLIDEANTSSYAKILLDNQILFDSLNGYEFKHTSNFKTHTLNNGKENYEFYLEKGLHSITIQVDSSHKADIYEDLQRMLREMNELYLEVIKLTNGNVDENYNWNLDYYIPTAKTRIARWITEIEEMRVYVNETSKTNASKQNTLYQQLSNALSKLNTINKDVNKLPRNLGIFSEGANSAVKMLSSTLELVLLNELSVDKIYIHSTDVKAPKVNNNVFTSLFSVIQRVAKSGVDVEEDPNTINIWVNRSTQYVALMQQYADAYYTKDTGQKVRFSLLPNESKLIYANAAGTQPDAAFGTSANVPYDLGIRGALVDLRQFDNFGEVISEFAPGSLMNKIVEDRVYGIPETQDFLVQYYRTDLISDLGISVPNTYDDIVDILPSLQRYQMNYYMPIAGGTGLKNINTTAQFIYQYGGDIYSDDFLTAGIDSPEAIQAMNMMVDLFQLYSLPLSTVNFYDSFRSGTVPIGIAGFDTYLQITHAAPEIVGNWDIALIPGVYDSATDTINRTNTSSGKEIVMFEKSNKKQATWDFITWWMSDDIQASFANDVQATYGPTFLWNTANIDAFSTIAINDRHKSIILEQYKDIYQIPQTPATYMVERGISDIWNAAVFENESVRNGITDQMIIMNKELQRKYIEFGYLDAAGKVLKPYYVSSIEDVIRWQKGEN